MKNKGKQNKFFKFFNKWTLFGVILVLGSIIIADKLSTYQIALIASRLLETIGIALIIGAIFDMSKNTSEFTSMVSDILSDIIVSKNFLTRLSETDKRDALSLVLQPSDKQIEQYSNINEYFNKQIDSSMKIFDTNFKSHTVFNVNVQKENGKVVAKGKMSYRIYKIRDKYEPMTMTFERSGSKIEKKRILYPGGTKEIELNDEQIINETVAGISYKKFVYEIPDELNKYPYLTIESEVYEPGFDHWTNFQWGSLTPYDGISFTLRCEDNLIIHEHVVFDEKQLYDVEYSEDKKSIKILSTEWLNAYTGFSITIGEKR